MSRDRGMALEIAYDDREESLPRWQQSQQRVSCDMELVSPRLFAGEDTDRERLQLEQYLRHTDILRSQDCRLAHSFVSRQDSYYPCNQRTRDCCPRNISEMRPEQPAEHDISIWIRADIGEISVGQMHHPPDLTVALLTFVTIVRRPRCMRPGWMMRKKLRERTQLLEKRPLTVLSVAKSSRAVV